MMKLYGFPPTRSIRALWTLHELEVEFEFVQVNLIAGENRRPEFLALNPAGKLPVLVDGDFVLTESVAIVLYLAEKYADKGLLPTGLEARARVDHWLLFTVTELEQPLWRISRHTALYPKEKRLPGEVALARQDFQDMAAVMEKHMTGRRFIEGDRVTVADFVAAYTLDWANEVHLLDASPQLRRYMDEMYTRPRAPLRIAAALASVRGERPGTTGLRSALCGPAASCSISNEHRGCGVAAVAGPMVRVVQALRPAAGTSASREKRIR